MSNLIFVCGRDPRQAPAETELRRVADRITPAPLAGPPHQVALGPGLGLCLTGPAGAAAMEGTSARLGALAGTWTDWHRPGSPAPDGTYALVRAGGEGVELRSDALGSRTLWYVLTETRFLASTSQRALACLLGGLDLDRAALAWFLSGGNLGPTAAWDRRIRRLPGNAALRLDRAAWTLDLRAEAPPEIRPEPMGARACEEELLRILRAAFRRYDFTTARWALPLSGGCDSRFILAMLVEAGWKPPAITWGLAASLDQPGNDAYVARKLAAHFGLEHDYLLTDPTAEVPPAEVVDRFLAASGGTTDQLFPYLDGLRMWASFAERGIDGMIRGDEAFGYVSAGTEAHARTCVGLMPPEDILGPRLTEAIVGTPQPLPETLARRPEESVATYRDRLYQGFRVPVGLAALNDVKAPFVEIASPLLSRDVLAFVRRMPDALRTDKAAFGRVARRLGPSLPYATSAADDGRDGYLGSQAYRGWLGAELDSPTLAELLPADWRAELRAHLAEAPLAPDSVRSARATLKRVIPTSWVRAVRARMKPVRPSRRHLALRAALAGRMVDLLCEDARTLDPARQGER